MSNFYYSGNGGIIYKSTNGLVTRTAATIPAGTVLAASVPLQGVGDVGLYEVDIYLTASGGTEAGGVAFARFLKMPTTTVGGSLISTRADSTTRIHISAVPMQLGDSLSLTLETPSKADYLWGYINTIYTSRL